MSNAIDAEKAPAANAQPRETEAKKKPREGREARHKSEAREEGEGWQEEQPQANQSQESLYNFSIAMLPLSTAWVWHFVFLGVCVAFLLEWRYANRRG